MDLLNGARKKVLERYHSMSSLEDDEDAPYPSPRLINNLPEPIPGQAVWEKSCFESGSDGETVSGSESSYDTEKSDESVIVPSLEYMGEDVRNHISHLNSKINSLNKYINKLHSDCDTSMNRNSVLEERLYRSDEEIEFYKELFYTSKLERTTIFITIPVVSTDDVRKYHFISNVLESYGKTDGGKSNTVDRIDTRRTMPNTDINNKGTMDKRNDHNDMDKKDTSLDMKDGMDEKENRKNKDRMNKKANSIGAEENRKIKDKKDDRMNKKANGIGTEENRKIRDKKDDRMNKKANGIGTEENRKNKDKKGDRMNKKANGIGTEENRKIRDKKDDRMNKKANGIGTEENRKNKDKKGDRMNKKANGIGTEEKRNSMDKNGIYKDSKNNMDKKDNRMNKKANHIDKEEKRNNINMDKEVDSHGMDMGAARRMINDENDGCDRIDKVGSRQNRINERFNTGNKRISNYSLNKYKKLPPLEKVSRIPLSQSQKPDSKISTTKATNPSKPNTKQRQNQVPLTNEQGAFDKVTLPKIMCTDGSAKEFPRITKKVQNGPVSLNLIKSVPPLPNMYKPKPSLIKSVPPLPNIYKPKPSLIKSVPPLPNMYKPKPSLIKSVPPLPNMYKPKPSLIKSVPPLPNIYKPKPPSVKQIKRPYAGKSRRLPPISDLKTELEKQKKL